MPAIRVSGCSADEQRRHRVSWLGRGQLAALRERSSVARRPTPGPARAQRHERTRQRERSRTIAFAQTRACGHGRPERFHTLGARRLAIGLPRFRSLAPAATPRLASTRGASAVAGSEADSQRWRNARLHKQGEGPSDPQAWSLERHCSSVGCTAPTSPSRSSYPGASATPTKTYATRGAVTTIWPSASQRRRWTARGRAVRWSWCPVDVVLVAGAATSVALTRARPSRCP